MKTLLHVIILDFKNFIIYQIHNIFTVMIILVKMIKYFMKDIGLM